MGTFLDSWQTGTVLGMSVRVRGRDGSRPWEVRLLAAADVGSGRELEGRRLTRGHCDVESQGRWRRVRLKQRAGCVPRHSKDRRSRAAPHTSTLRPAPTAAVTLTSSSCSSLQASGAPPTGFGPEPTPERPLFPKPWAACLMS